jgi:hypothetical protein
MRITSQLYDRPGGNLLLDMTDRVVNPRFACNARGYHDWSGFVPMVPAEAFRWYDFSSGHIVISWGAIVLYQGRVEDPKANGDPTMGAVGLDLMAFGYSQAYSDTLYAALWSTQRTDEWEQVITDQVASRCPERFEFQTDGALKIMPRSDDQFDNTHIGSLTYAIPHNSVRQILTVSFDYDVFLPTTWTASLSRFTDGFTFQSTVWTVNGNGFNQTGTQSLSITACDRLMLNCFYNTAVSAVYTGETGAFYVRIWNLRIKTTASATVDLSEIAGALVSYVDAINPYQVDSLTAYIQATGIDLKEALFEDMTPAAILDDLVIKGDSSGRRWDWSVFEYQRLRLAYEGYGGLTWYVDSAPPLLRSLGNIENEQYALYQDAAGRTKRTAVATDSGSAGAFGIKRRGVINASTTSQTEAELIRTVQLNDKRYNGSLGEFEVKYLRAVDGAIVPGWYARPGDRIIARGYPAGSASSIDYIRWFPIFATDFGYGIPGDRRQLGRLRITSTRLPVSLPGLLARRG